MWPQGIGEWVELVAEILLIGGILWGIGTKAVRDKFTLLKKEIKGDIDGIGERVNTVTAKADRTGTLLEKVEFDMQKAAFERQSQAKEISQLEQLMKDLAKSVEKQRETHEIELRKMSDTVVRMETTVGHMADMNREMVKHLARRE